MRISRDQIICGVPAFDLRAAFKRLRAGGWDAESLKHTLDVEAGVADAVLQQLLAEGYAEPTSFARGRQIYEVTTKGRALALSSALAPINRQKADGLVAEVIQRATEINGDSQELYHVAKLWAFGSYLSEADQLGDVDIAFELARNNADWPPMPEGEYAYSEATAPKSWLRDDLGVLAWPYEAVLRRLKARRRHISLHPSTDAVLEGTEMKLIFAS